VDEGVKERVAEYAEDVEMDLNFVEPDEGFGAQTVHAEKDD
jgi:hypothetical protein